MRNQSLTWAIFSLAIMVTSCAVPANQGKLARSFEVTQLVEADKVLDGHTYYYTGPEAEPDAIIAIDDRYTLKSKYWIRVENPAKKLADWNHFIDNGIRIFDPFEGAWIMTPDGEKAGIWYSKYDHTVVRYPDASSIIVYIPVVPLESARHVSVF